MRKDKLFDEYKEQQKKKRREAELVNARLADILAGAGTIFEVIRWCSRAQLQQLESRLRYSKTDKDAAEKKQRILMEKDLVELQVKLHEFEVSRLDTHHLDRH